MTPQKPHPQVLTISQSERASQSGSFARLGRALEAEMDCRGAPASGGLLSSGPSSSVAPGGPPAATSEEHLRALGSIVTTLGHVDIALLRAVGDLAPELRASSSGPSRDHRSPVGGGWPGRRRDQLSASSPS